MVIRRTRTVRIDVDLDLQIKDLAKRNNLKFTQASRELAKMTEKLKGKRLREVKEIVF